ncbi:hypothetical protein CS0771_40470 [Catellatospora sp. IY07-71]|uniref:hypothetical protein n=1 Tax=Catellatospora sp. IY07-71 TaxID=2728827 RepID=UPI001BB446A7|nr:hypothetical protein [Catellatospora sp. IY07-71]BCJ74503.1 hypothetical protein CS0771_40470 [Catellatospora sp. IY07-71]
MNPTLNPVRPAVDALPEAIAAHLDLLTREPDTRTRNQVAAGWLRSCLDRLAAEVTTDSGRDEIADALAMLAALLQADRADARWTYDRAAVDLDDEHADTPATVPDGIALYHVTAKGWERKR